MEIESIYGYIVETCDFKINPQNWLPNFTPGCDGKFRFIYCTRNLINNKIYVGQHTTKNLDDGYLGSGKILRKAIEKYSKENFVIRHCCYCNDTNELNEAEKYWIAYWDSKNNKIGYNLTEGGGGVEGLIAWNKGIPMSEEQKIKLRKPKSEETKKKLSLSKKGKRLSEEHKNKISDSIRGDKNGFFNKRHTDETKMKLSSILSGRVAHNKGVPMSEQQKIKLSLSKKGKPSPNKGKNMSDSQKLKLSEVNKGKKLSEDHKRKILEYNKNNPLTEQQKLNLSLKLKGYVHKIIICPYCNKSGGETSMKRWHFDNCKYK